MSLSQIIQESFNADPTMDEAVTFLTESTLPLLKAGEADLNVILESFNTEPYKITERFTKGSGRIGYNFTDKAGEDFQILFIKDNSYGQNVTRVRFGKRRGNVFVDKIDRFADPRAVIATYLNVFSEFLTTAEGITQRGFVMDISGAAAARAVPILRKIINATLRSKVSVVKQEFDTEPPRRNIWITKGTLAASAVFNGKACQGAPWMSSNDVQVGSDEAPKPKADATTKSGVDNAGVKKAKFNPMDAAQIVVNEITPALKKVWPTASVTISNTQPLKVVSFQVFTDGQVQRTFAFAHKQLQDGVNVKDFTKHIVDTVKAYQKNVSELQAKKQAELEQAANLKKDPAFYLKQQQSAIEGALNTKLKGYGFTVKFHADALAKDFVDMFVMSGKNQAAKIQCPVDSSAEENIEYAIKELNKNGVDGKNPIIPYMADVTIRNSSSYYPGSTSDLVGRVVDTQSNGVSVLVDGKVGRILVKWSDIKVGSDHTGRTKTQTQTGSGKVKVEKDPNMDLLIDAGLKDVKKVGNEYSAQTKASGELLFNVDKGRLYSVRGPNGGVDSDPSSNGTWKGENVLKRLVEGAYWVGKATKDFKPLAYELFAGLSSVKTTPSGYKIVNTVHQVYPDRIYVQRYLKATDGSELTENYQIGRPVGSNLYLEVNVGPKHSDAVFFREFTYMASEIIEEMIKVSGKLVPTPSKHTNSSVKDGQTPKGVSVFWKDGTEKYARIVGLEGTLVKLSKWDSRTGEYVEWESDLSRGYFFDDGKYNGDRVTMGKLIELLNA